MWGVLLSSRCAGVADGVDAGGGRPEVRLKEEGDGGGRRMNLGRGWREGWEVFILELVCTREKLVSPPPAPLFVRLLC